MFLASRWSLRLPWILNRGLSARTNPLRLRSSLNKQPPPSPLPRRQQNPSAETREQPSKLEAVSENLSQSSDGENTLLTPVHIPEDPHGVLKETHPAMPMLDNSSIVIQRQLEMMNVLMGFEQANKYVIIDPHGNHIGFLAEQEHGLGGAFARQMFRTHRSFMTHVFDRSEREVLRFHRPFSLISSRIRVYDAVRDDFSTGHASSTALQGISTGSVINETSAQVSPIPIQEMRIIGAADQEWAPLRRKYNLFLARKFDQNKPNIRAPQLTSGELPLSTSKALQVAEGDPRQVDFSQFARVDEPFLSWDFTLLSEDGRLIGSVNRNFAGFAREIFTDTGVYALRMDAASLAAEPPHLISNAGAYAKDAMTESSPGMTLDQRAVMLATAVSIDFDYFSRHSSSTSMGWMPMWFPMGGGAADAGGAAGAGAVVGAGGAAETGAVGAGAGAARTGVEAAESAGVVSNAARGLGAGEGAMAGAGTMAGYEAMQRARNNQQQDDASSAAVDPYEAQQTPRQGRPNPQNQQDEVWGERTWGGNNNKNDSSPWGQEGGDEGQGGRGEGGS
ncbi:Scramblase-domain-containing protein [Glonium stellatum]|uniref:Scramblase-domain-containing protein n=1 Tax=Glonium stellatum TaxID=574774 RepID=A0A8E2F2H9_9PEZI|nr:Scramblase-domain-containing protein [Glonium stellatum]